MTFAAAESVAFAHIRSVASDSPDINVLAARFPAASGTKWDLPEGTPAFRGRVGEVPSLYAKSDPSGKTSMLLRES